MDKDRQAIEDIHRQQRIDLSSAQKSTMMRCDGLTHYHGNGTANN